MYSILVYYKLIVTTIIIMADRLEDHEKIMHKQEDIRCQERSKCEEEKIRCEEEEGKFIIEEGRFGCEEEKKSSGGSIGKNLSSCNK